MAKTEGFGERLRERLRAIGYWNRKTNKPDVIRFSVERGYVHSYLYRWLSGETPRAQTLLRLARDLGVPPEWLLGQTPPDPARKRRKTAPIRGGSYVTVPLPEAPPNLHNAPEPTRETGAGHQQNQLLNPLPLLGSWWHRLTWVPTRLTLQGGTY